MKNLALILLLVVSVSSCQNDRATSNIGLQSAGSAEKLQAVGVVNPAMRDFESEVSISGTAMANQTVKVHAMESGYITSIKVDIGDYLKKGATIARLANPELSSQVTQSKATQTMSQANIKKYEAEKKKYEAIKMSKESIYNRLNKTYKKAPNIVLVSDVENAKADYDAAMANVEAAEAAIAAAKGEQGASAGVVNAYTSRAGMLIVRAPFSGIVTKRYVDNGATVQSGLSASGSMPLVEMQDISTIRVMVQLPESDAASVSKGTVVSIEFPELAGKSISAEVTRTSNTLDAQSKTMQVEIDLKNTDGKLKPGMFAKVNLGAKSRKGILSLPIGAKKLIDDIAHVLIVKNDMVEAIPLRQGVENKSYFECLNSEITASAIVVVQGKNLVKAGQKVKASLLK